MKQIFADSENICFRNIQQHSVNYEISALLLLKHLCQNYKFNSAAIDFFTKQVVSRSKEILHAGFLQKWRRVPAAVGKLYL